MNMHAALFARHHGLVKTRELLAAGTDTEMIRWTRNYRKIVRVRQGWWALPGTDDRLMQAWRSGGRLACVSALAFHGEIVDLGDPLHIEVPEHSSRKVPQGVVVHWSRDQRNGDRRAVSIEVARAQASRCRAANGTL